MLPSDLASDSQFRARFDREARVISQLTHPHICTLYDVGEDSGAAFLVMELLQGQSLADRLRKGALPLDEALRIAIDIADALSTAHRAGIVHRDLKPGNIMLTKAGAKLLDFGLAKTAAPAVAMSTTSTHQTATAHLTGPGSILGTLHYMAPEQVEGREADTRSDIWAFGAVLYEMLTGQLAFAGESSAGVMGAILKDRPLPVSSRRRDVPSALDHLVARCLERDVEERWQSVGDIRSQLTWLAASSTSPVGPIGNPAPRKGRSFAPWMTVAVLLGLLAAALLYGVGSGGRRAGPLANAVPVVILMDTSAPAGVYDPQTRKNSGTNADDISDALGSLPVALHKETLSASWNREDQIIKQNPDLVVIHRSAFAHAMVLEFELGYAIPSGPSGAPTSSSDVPPPRVTLEDRLVPFGWDKQEAFMGYVGGMNPRTWFLVYSRGWPDEAARVAWEQSMVRRFPTLKDRVSAIHITVRDGTASFRDPQTIDQLTQAVRSLLDLKAPRPQQ